MAGLCYVILGWLLGRRLRLTAAGSGLMRPWGGETFRFPPFLLNLPFDLVTGLTLLSTLMYLNLHLTKILSAADLVRRLHDLLALTRPSGVFLDRSVLLLQALMLVKLLTLGERVRTMASPRDPDLTVPVLWNSLKIAAAAAGLFALDLGLFYLPLLLGAIILVRFFYRYLFSAIVALGRLDGLGKRLLPRMQLFLLVMSLLALAWGAFLTWPVYFVRDHVLYAGFTVFSDLSPHTALVRSFGVGANIPAQYPHFSDAGMRYHFFFFFMAGLLNRLGFGVDLALNLPSMLGTWAFCQALGVMACRLSRRLMAFPLTLLLFMFRSSFSGFVLLYRELRAGASLPEALGSLSAAEHFAGPLLHDDWGLYNLNVYANQRHLLWALALVLYLMLLFLPALSAGAPLKAFFRRGAWRGGLFAAVRLPALPYVFLLTFPLAYWHGSAAICLLLIFACWALFSRAKSYFLAAGVFTVAGALLFRVYLADGHKGAPAGSFWQPGYTLADRSPAGVLLFLVTLFGPAFFLMLAALAAARCRRDRVWTFSLLLPSVFGLLFSLTPDVTVNHKFFMVTQLFFLPFVSALLLRFWQVRRARVPVRAAVLVLTACLCFTGLTDFWAFRNQSARHVSAPLSDRFTTWVSANCDPDRPNLTPPWAWHPYFCCGRQSLYGHSYYAASAGYPTDERLDEIRRFLAAAPGELSRLKAFPKKFRAEFLFIDDGWRQNRDYVINEARLAELFPLAASFPEYGNLKIYDLR